MSREIFDKVDISLRSPKADWFRYLNTDKGKEWKFWWDNIRPKETEQFIKRWSMDSDMQNRSLFPRDKYCLTCNKPERMIESFYGDWNYCHCPTHFSLGTLPLHRGVTTRRLIMKWEVKTELVVQEKDDKAKKAMIVKYSTMDVVADDFEGAVTAAKELCLEGENITSCAVILEE